MYRFTSLLMTSILLMAIVVVLGCSQSAAPTSPADDGAALRDPTRMGDEGRYLWGLYEIVGDENHENIQMMPVHSASFHLNARRFLENGPCVNCIQLTKVVVNGAGNTVLTIRLMHPFPAQFQYTGFDVRGILIFDGTSIMPSSGLVAPDKTLNDCELVNADGFTSLYNTVMYPPGSQPFPILEYSTGKHASPGTFTGTLNGYKIYYNILNRHVYSPRSGGVMERDFEVFIPPGSFRLGYAVDASWVPPTGPPPYENPINDWPPVANQAEAYQISCYMGTIPPLGGNAEILIDIYDWQGPQTISKVEVECPVYFTGFAQAEFLENGSGYVRYHAYVWNNLNPHGDAQYQVLVRVSDTQVPDSDIGRKAYQIMRVAVPADTPGQDMIVLADLTAFMLSPLVADNAVYLYNMVSYVPPEGSPAADYKKILFYEGHGGTMWYNDATTKSLVQAAGYEYIRHSNEPLHAMETTYKCIFIFMPGYFNHTAWFTEPEVAELKQFAENGGRLIPISERGIVMTNKDVFNKLLADLGSGIFGTKVDWPYEIYIPQEFIFPDQITENVHTLFVQWPSSLLVTPIDKVIFILPDQYNNDIVMARSRIIID